MNNILLTDNFYHDLLSLVNNCNLPVETAFFVLKTVTLEVEKIYIDGKKDQVKINKHQQVINPNKEDQKEKINEKEIIVFDETKGMLSNNDR